MYPSLDVYVIDPAGMLVHIQATDGNYERLERGTGARVMVCGERLLRVVKLVHHNDGWRGVVAMHPHRRLDLCDACEAGALAARCRGVVA